MGWEGVQGRNTAFLKEAVDAQRIPPAYLFVGPVGSGTRETAWALSQILLGSEKEQHPDRFVLTPEKGSIKIEQIRELLQRISLKPLEASRMVFIIEAADKMTPGAANALLKILEEPPAYALFILLSDTPDLLPATVRSRCQRLIFSAAPAAYLDQAQGSEVFQQFQRELLPFFNQRTGFLQVSKKAEEWAAEGSLLPNLLQWLRVWWHDLIVYRETNDTQGVLFKDQAALLAEAAALRSPERLFHDCDLIDEALHALAGNVQKTLLLERLFAGLIPTTEAP